METFNSADISELIELLDEALLILKPLSGGYSGEYLTVEEFYSDLSVTVDRLKEGKPFDLNKLWGWFAPTCEWDDFVGDVELGQKVFDQIEKVRNDIDSNK